MRTSRQRREEVSRDLKELLDRREASGLRFTAIAAIAYTLFSALSQFGTTDSPWLIRASQLNDLIQLGLLGTTIALVRKNGHLRAGGATLVASGIVAIVTIPILWYLSVGGSAIPVSYLLKTMTTQFFMMIILLSMIPGRLFYPAISALAALAAEAIYLVLARSDPRVGFSDSYIQAVFGPPVGNGFVWANLSLLLEAGAIAAVICVRTRNTVVEAVGLQAKNARLARYFSPNVAKKLLAERSGFFAPGGTTQEVAILFADIRSFTSISEELRPSEVLELLSAYHRKMVDALFQHGGTLDKFIGDGIMATFGTPEPAPDDADRAMAAGLAMKVALAEMNEERASRGLSIIGQGIGIHYGRVIAGNIGTSERLEYTVIGDAVNVASRIESACKETSREFLVSRALKERLACQAGLESIGEVGIRGKRETIELFAVPPSMWDRGARQGARSEPR